MSRPFDRTRAAAGAALRWSPVAATGTGLGLGAYNVGWAGANTVADQLGQATGYTGDPEVLRAKVRGAVPQLAWEGVKNLVGLGAQDPASKFIRGMSHDLAVPGLRYGIYKNTLPADAPAAPRSRFNPLTLMKSTTPIGRGEQRGLARPDQAARPPAVRVGAAAGRQGAPWAGTARRSPRPCGARPPRAQGQPVRADPPAAPAGRPPRGDAGHQAPRRGGQPGRLPGRSATPRAAGEDPQRHTLRPGQQPYDPTLGELGDKAKQLRGTVPVTFHGAARDAMKRLLPGHVEKRSDFADYVPTLIGAGAGGLGGYGLARLAGAHEPWRGALYGTMLGGVAGSHYGSTAAAAGCPRRPGSRRRRTRPRRAWARKGLTPYYGNAPGGVQGVTERRRRQPAALHRDAYDPRRARLPARTTSARKFPIHRGDGRAEGRRWSHFPNGGTMGDTLLGMYPPQAVNPVTIGMVDAQDRLSKERLHAGQAARAGARGGFQAGAPPGGAARSTRRTARGMTCSPRWGAPRGSPRAATTRRTGRTTPSARPNSTPGWPRSSGSTTRSTPARTSTAPRQAEKALDWFKGWIGTRKGSNEVGALGRDWGHMFAHPAWEEIRPAAVRRMPGAGQEHAGRRRPEVRLPGQGGGGHPVGQAPAAHGRGPGGQALLGRGRPGRGPEGARRAQEHGQGRGVHAVARPVAGGRRPDPAVREAGARRLGGRCGRGPVPAEPDARTHAEHPGQRLRPLGRRRRVHHHRGAGRLQRDAEPRARVVDRDRRRVQRMGLQSDPKDQEHAQDPEHIQALAESWQGSTCKGCGGR